MITPENLVTDNLSKVMSLRSKGVVMLDYFIRAVENHNDENQEEVKYGKET